MLSNDQARRNIAANVRRLRGSWSLGELARRVGTYPSNILRVEAAETLPSAAFLARLAEALGTTPNDLLADPEILSKRS